MFLQCHAVDIPMKSPTNVNSDVRIVTVMGTVMFNLM